MADEEEPECCPLCMEELDLTDKTFNACPCGYQVRSRPPPPAAPRAAVIADRALPAPPFPRLPPRPLPAGLSVVLAPDQERVQRAVPGLPRAILGAVQAQEPAGPRGVRPRPTGRSTGRPTGPMPFCPTPCSRARRACSVLRRTKQRKQREKHERRSSAQQQTKCPPVNRKSLTNVRVMQRNLVYVIGLPQHFTDEEVGERSSGAACPPRRQGG